MDFVLGGGGGFKPKLSSIQHNICYIKFCHFFGCHTSSNFVPYFENAANENIVFSEWFHCAGFCFFFVSDCDGKCYIFCCCRTYTWKLFYVCKLLFSIKINACVFVRSFIGCKRCAPIHCPFHNPLGERCCHTEVKQTQDRHSRPQRSKTFDFDLFSICAIFLFIFLKSEISHMEMISPMLSGKKFEDQNFVRIGFYTFGGGSNFSSNSRFRK